MSHYCYHCGYELAETQLVCPKCFHCSLLDYYQSSDIIKNVGVLNAQQLETNTQWYKYRCGKSGNTGHGYAAEDANHIEEFLRGVESKQIGRSNTKNGPDRIVNDGHSQIQIQTKYYRTAKNTINSTFDPTTKLLRYEGQLIEVPKDQYVDCLDEMGKRIQEGKVPGYTDPADASKIVKCGDFTYKQALNITKAGNIDSLRFDAKTHSITAMSSFGISFVIQLFLCGINCKNSNEFNDAIQLSFLRGIQNGTISLSSGILASQLLRTHFGRNIIAATLTKETRNVVNGIYDYDFGKKIIHNLVKRVYNKSFYGQAAKDSARKLSTEFLRTNVIANLSLLVVLSLPDTYKVLCGTISKPQFLKNILVSGSSIAASTIGAYLGFLAGGTPGAWIGGSLTGIVSSIGARALGNKIYKDDQEQMLQLVKMALLQLSSDYLIQSEDEFNQAMDYISIEKALDTQLLQAMYQIGKDDNDDFLRIELAYARLEYYFFIVAKSRKCLKLSQINERVLSSINDLGNDVKQLKLEMVNTSN